MKEERKTNPIRLYDFMQLCDDGYEERIQIDNCSTEKTIFQGFGPFGDGKVSAYEEWDDLKNSEIIDCLFVTIVEPLESEKMRIVVQNAEDYFYPRKVQPEIPCTAPATSKQIRYLHKLAPSVNPEGLTIKNANELIQKNLHKTTGVPTIIEPRLVNKEAKVKTGDIFYARHHGINYHVSGYCQIVGFSSPTKIVVRCVKPKTTYLPRRSPYGPLPGYRRAFKIKKGELLPAIYDSDDIETDLKPWDDGQWYFYANGFEFATDDKIKNYETPYGEPEGWEDD